MSKDKENNSTFKTKITTKSHTIPPAYGLCHDYKYCRLCTGAHQYKSQTSACVRPYQFCMSSVAAKLVRARSTLGD
eukprot:3705260-Rhodomonas_salina.1